MFFQLSIIEYLQLTAVVDGVCFLGDFPPTDFYCEDVEDSSLLRVNRKVLVFPCWGVLYGYILTSA